MPNLLKPIRLLHLYLGVFAAPALLFFSITGALQTFSLHETTKGRDYKPPKLFVQLAQLHKKQTLEVPNKKPAPPAAAKPDSDHTKAEKPSGDTPQANQSADNAPPRAPQTPPTPTPPAKQKNLLPMKIFFLIISVSLLLSTCSGIYMSYKYNRNRALVSTFLAAGLVVPLLLAFL